ncbi:MAG: ubiquinol-cytochrome c reductase iron-sulfur subunit [Nitrospinota bacterium]
MESDVREAYREREEVREVARPSRRSFLDSLLGGMIAVLVGATLYPIVRYLWPHQRKGGARGQTLSFPLAQLPVGSARFLRFRGEPAVVIRTEGAVYALSAVCTHLGCIVKWDEARGQLACPCHAAYFDVNGNVLAGPAPRPLPSFEVRVVGEKIVLGGA